MRRLKSSGIFRWFALVVILACGLPCAYPQGVDRDGVTFFETSVRPLLVEHCLECHGAEGREGELRLDTFQGLIEGGASGPLFTAGDPDKSLLIMAVEYRDPGLQMPPEKPLSKREIRVLRDWIGMGLPHPDSAGEAEARKPTKDWRKAREHWAFQPLLSPAIPTEFLDSRWGNNPIDRFILAGLQANGLSPAEPADRRTLIRRATLDLHGLPPTPEEINAFLVDKSPRAFERVIERLLASPRYGERWGRHWLDVVRYADSNGLDENIAHGNAWRYRDYVIDSFNRDVAFDTFIVEQIAGDQLASGMNGAATQSSDQGSADQHRQLIATGFLSLGPKVLAEVDEQKMEMDIVDEQVSTFGTAFLGMTFGCARCHDHKFDPISMRDYYALAGVFQSTKTMDSFTKIAKWHENEIPTEAELVAKRAHEVRLQQLRQTIDDKLSEARDEIRASLAEGAISTEDIDARFDDETKQHLGALREQLAAMEKSVPVFSSAMGVVDGKVVDAPLHLRGSHLTLGEVIPRGVPEVFPDELRPQFPENTSGRLQLAQWLVASDVPHPLTSRVLVNRVWRWHFGKGLVSSPDNFGILGDKPTHPELLDWLARRLIQFDWSLKALHREIMLSATYQLSAVIDGRKLALDPENRWMWRANPRRLEAESLRDSLLAVGGLLNSQMGGSMLHVGNRQFLFDHTSKDETTYDHRRRSVYLPVIRNNIYDFYQLFDYADASVPNGNRNTSTVATQALFMLNSPLVMEASENLASQLTHLETIEERLNALFMKGFGREPADEEIVQAKKFIKDFQSLFCDESAGEEAGERAAWAALGQAILASSEFVFIP